MKRRLRALGALALLLATSSSSFSLLADDALLTPATPNPLAPELTPQQVVELININTATLAQLEALDKIGPVKAQAIIDWRQAHGPFTSFEQLLAVHGIGPHLLELNRHKIAL